MELRALEWFVAVAEYGSMRGAARHLGVTQPALTKAIRRLEDETGVILLHRRARGVTLTAYGQALLRHAGSVRASLRDAREELSALRIGMAGHVRVGAGPAWHRAVLPEAIAAFRAERPLVRIQLLGGLDESLKAQLRAGVLDFVLAALPDAPQFDPDLVRKALLTDEYRVVAARHHPLRRRNKIALADLIEFPWILPSAATYLAERLRVLFRAQGLPPPDAVIETDITGLKLALMRDGPYLSFQATGHLENLEAWHIQPLEVPSATWRRQAGVIMRRGTSPSPAAAALIRTIETVCAVRSSAAASPAKVIELAE